MTDAVDIALDVCDVLANAHANGVVHGDLGLHRVRTTWPRLPGQVVDIFALEENDSAAFAFRASAVAILVAPEQRAGRQVDIRADVWAVGAILHWMIAAVPPSSDALERTLAGAPRTLIVTVEACLSEDPARRPQTVDEIAEVIGSFASSPPERFEQLARRRVALASASRVRKDLGDIDNVLGRLDDAALEREVALASEQPPAVAKNEPIDRLMLAVHRSTGSAVFAKSAPSLSSLDDDDDDDAATRLAAPRYVEPENVVTAPLSIAPVILSSELLSPPKDSVPAPILAPHTATVATKSSVLPTALGLVGALAAVAIGVGIGVRLMDRAAAHEPTSASAPAAAPAPTADGARASTKPAAQGPTASATTSAIASARALVFTPASLPDAPLATPSSLPNAPPRPSVSPPRARPSSASSDMPRAREDSAPAVTASPTALTDAL